MIKNADQNSKSKHIQVQYHFLGAYHLEGNKIIEYVPNESQITCTFTDPLDSTRFARLQGELNVSELK